MNLDAHELLSGHLLRDVRALASNYRWPIIDGPPGIGRTSTEAVRAADCEDIERVLSHWCAGAALDTATEDVPDQLVRCAKGVGSQPQAGLEASQADRARPEPTESGECSFIGMA